MSDFFEDIQREIEKRREHAKDRSVAFLREGNRAGADMWLVVRAELGSLLLSLYDKARKRGLWEPGTENPKGQA